MNKVVVLGANSFSGQDCVDLLLDDPGREVIGISRSQERSDLFLKYRLRDDLANYRYVQIDMNTQMPALLELIDAEQPEVIVNFAAQSEVAPSWDHPEHWYQTNCVALAEMVNHLRRRAYLRRYVHISSPEVYGTCVGNVGEDAPIRPSTPYAASKAAADLLLQTYFKQFGFPVVFVRATNVYGARQQLFKIIPRSVIFARLGTPIELHGGGVAVKSYIHIRDVSRGVLALIEAGRVGQIYHLSPDRGVAVRDVVRAVCERVGRPFEASVVMSPERPGQDGAYTIDSSKARREIGWKPQVSFDDGLSEVVAWVCEYWDDIVTQPLSYRHHA